MGPGAHHVRARNISSSVRLSCSSPVTILLEMQLCNFPRVDWWGCLMQVLVNLRRREPLKRSPRIRKSRRQYRVEDAGVAVIWTYPGFWLHYLDNSDWRMLYVTNFNVCIVCRCCWRFTSSSTVVLHAPHSCSAIHSNQLLTSDPSTPKTLPPLTTTPVPTSSICRNSKGPSPPSPSHSRSASRCSSSPPMATPESFKPFALLFLTSDIAFSSDIWTRCGGSAVKRSALFAAIRTGISLGPLLVVAPVYRFCRESRTSCRYSAASLSPPSSATDAASTTKIMPRTLVGLTSCVVAKWRSFPWPGVSSSRKRRARS